MLTLSCGGEKTTADVPVSTEDSVAPTDAPVTPDLVAPTDAPVTPDLVAPTDAVVTPDAAAPTDAAVAPDVVDASTGTIIQPTKTFPGELPEWCMDQPADFSFFVTSMAAIWALSDSVPDDLSGGGFGGDFQGLEGADSICQTIAIATGHGHKRWRALLSATDDGNGNPVHAIDRIGQGPWHDANGRLVATGLAGLMGTRPDGDPQTINDLPDECGVPISMLGDAHDVPTGSNKAGQLRSNDPESTCNDWTSNDPTVGVSSGGGGPGSGGPSANAVFCGHTFPRQGGGGGPGGGRGGDGEPKGQEWLSDHKLKGCGKGAVITQGQSTETCIGCSGGYGALYCFAEVP